VAPLFSVGFKQFLGIAILDEQKFGAGTNSARYQKQIASILELPTLPNVVMKIMEILEDPRTTAKRLTETMELDPALAGKILKLVNSAYYGLRNRISSVRQAIVILGFATIKSIAISASVLDMFGSSQLDKEGFWMHCLGTASLSRYLGRKTPGINEEDCFIFGLLHDIGKLVMDQHFPKIFAIAFAKAQKDASTFYDAENTSIDTTHAEIGSFLVERWGLPSNLVEAIRIHHHPAKAEGNSKRLIAINRVSNYLCASRKMGSNADFGPALFPAKELELIGLDEEDLDALSGEIDVELKKVSDLYTSA
jgi:putative nucleotidyltransferase with HDIG domain